ncbi:hypothetical protein Hanom_Chr12g01138871 [Helianthus anomalus]
MRIMMTEENNTISNSFLLDDNSRLFFINMKMNLMLFKVLCCPAPILSGNPYL